MTGPSLVKVTCMSAPKRPVETGAPRLVNAAATASMIGSATEPGAAWSQVGRRPLRVSAYNVNWLTMSTGSSRSRAETSRGADGGRQVASEACRCSKIRSP